MDVLKIRWKQGDYITLGRAVADFNKKIDRLEKMEGLGYLPEKISYKETKKKIKSRKELNRIINSLKSFQKEGAENLVITQAGTFRTKWEDKQLKNQLKLSVKMLQEEKGILETPLPGATYSFAQMGSSRVREIERELEKIQSLETETNEDDLKKIERRIKALGSYDYLRNKAKVWRANYLKMLDDTYKNFDNYNKFKEKLESIEDPVEFFNYLKMNEKLVDIKYMYDLARLGVGGASAQDTFNELLKNIGIELDERKKIKNYKKTNKTYFRIK